MREMEWAKIEAGYQHVDSMVSRADGMHHGYYPFWFGWALREAFVAGAQWQEARSRPPDARTAAPEAGAPNDKGETRNAASAALMGGEVG